MFPDVCINNFTFADFEDNWIKASLLANPFSPFFA